MAIPDQAGGMYPFPEPLDLRVSKLPVWEWADVEEWARKTGRLGGKPKKTPDPFRRSEGKRLP